ncbi:MULTISPECIES: dihydroxy-acid dehydratase [Paenibacillus]|uniref:Dihydroxy-acid dehydratase n=2 Tax=Paenibacillus TaxID=44249 RepID=A0A0U2W7U9_9BACL|nr:MULTISPECIES: dihydroxy-acid dehydratase [Paenibacillus]ALS23573.1 dihydroxy-acid dehydratase [Paenibacillus naphthalenovorans]NTZ20671.1 dihydroxy-acid dehydratase [Paenibacillus sp. JMULE4]GCL74361.1 dehydratase [Paenibacillus naphthalenovorans]
MERKLRSYVEPGSVRWAMRRAQWGVFGINEEDMEKPKIAIVNTSSNLAACFAHLDGIAAKMKEEIRAAGGLPFEVRTAAPSDAVTSMGRKGGYILPARDLIVNDVEVAVEGAMLDGMICLVSCDKTVPGLLMAAARLNIPTIVVACGYQPSGQYRGEHIDFEDLWLNAVKQQNGKRVYSVEELSEMSKNAILGPGVCAGMGTANTMHIVCEALGMALPGSTPVLANSQKMWDTVGLAAKRIVQMVWDDLKPRDILVPEAFANAVKVVLAISGSINAVKHLQALAREAQMDVDIYGMFERFADEIPLLSAVRPNGEHTIEQFEAAGGAQAVLKQLESFLHTDTITVSGRTIKENLHGIAISDEEVIRPVNRAFVNRPSIVLIRGSLAPDTGIVKLAVTDDRQLQFSGPAIVFNSADEAIEGVHKGLIKPGHVVVVRGLGPKGAPGMGFLSNFVFALNGASLGDKVAVVTDGQQSGLSNMSLAVNEVSPEAAEGGPIGLVEDGDTIVIDVEKRFVNLEVPESELELRRSRLNGAPAMEEHGWLSIYQRLVRPLPETGGILFK